MGVSSEVAFYSRALKAPRIAALASFLADRARSEGWDYEQYLAQVLSEEVTSRESHGGDARVKAARRGKKRAPRSSALSGPSRGTPPRSRGPSTPPPPAK